MKVDTLKDTFFSLVAPDIPNEWDVEEAVEKLVSVDEEKCRIALQQVPVIWPVSHSLCFDYLKTVGSALDCFEVDTLSEWVNSALDQYEKQGLRAAQRYMADVEGNFLCPLRGENGVSFKDVHGRMLPYLRGLSGKPLELAPHEVVYTDTETVFVPHEISLFADNKDNIFLYKLLISYQWAFIACSSYLVTPGENAVHEEENSIGALWLQKFLTTFADIILAADVYHLLETVRVTAFLEKELPGLMRQMHLLSAEQKEALFIRHPEKRMHPGHLLRQSLFIGNQQSTGSSKRDKALQLIQHHREHAVSAMDSVHATSTLYSLIHDEDVPYSPADPLLFQGEMRLDTVRHARDKRLEENRELFIDAFASQYLKHTQEKQSETSIQESKGSGSTGEKDGLALVIESGSKPGSNKSDATIVINIDNEVIALDEELQQLAGNIIADMGYLPEQYISSAVGKAGKGYVAFQSSTEQDGHELSSPVVYDEWDYRRSDFRKKWVSIHEKQIPLTQSNFYPSTLEKYHGQIMRLRYQFEMMRTTERFVRRQRDGDDIDIDALIESVADSRAGLPPSDRLFVRLKRDERDIAVLFLIDMSNSTQGWVNEAIKESLVLLCEALEIVGDSYGIYGFSGMRRLRSEFFHIKHLNEPYDEIVKQRISSIAPREYTRMGPAIRHAVSLLQDVDSRVRLLITLSDGKPEDYDDYKGEYAIEDTRHALFEAKAAGIHPFCITVDRYAQEYIGHMYGSVNYILIDNVKQLPHRMPEVYRVLTN